MTGREAYEADVRRRPTYPDGAPRKTWEQLCDVARWSWERGLTPDDWGLPPAQQTARHGRPA